MCGNPALQAQNKIFITFLAVLPIKTQGAITLIAVLLGHTGAPIDTGGVHTGMESILQVDSRCEILLHVYHPVI